jgi:hypothetical protein
MPSEAELLMMLLTERDGSEFDGEIHLSSEEGERIRAVRSEPVAWRVLGSAGKIHAAVSANPDVAEGWRGSGYTVEALYTSPVQTREDGIREAARRIEGYIIEEQPGDVKTVLARKMVKSILALLSQPEPKT